MKKQTKAEKQADKRIEQSYYRTCSRVTIPIMAITGIYRTVRAAMTPEMSDAELDILVQETVATVRVN